MQHLLSTAITPRWYFAVGASEKSSLSIQYCRQNGLTYLNNPTNQQLRSIKKDLIIQADYQKFRQLQKIKPQLHLIYFGSTFNDQKLKQLRRQYMSIGRCKNVPKLDYSSCRKSLNSNIIFIYGPVSQQNVAAATTLAHNINYHYAQLPKNSNDLISHINKNSNYIINGLFTDINDIKIVNQYFNIKIVHFKYNRQDLPKLASFFDVEQDLVSHLKNQPYYIQVQGNRDPVSVMDQVGVKLCPKLIFINYDKHENKIKQYVNEYIEQTDGLLLSIYNIQSTRKNKNLPLATDFQSKIQSIDEILYKDLNRKQILLTDFPWHTNQFLTLENRNRKLSYFIDLSKSSKYTFSKGYSSQIYFLETQRRICPTFDLTLKQQITNQIEYWIVSGPSCSGKTSVAKYIASQFGMKLIEYEAQCALAKQKIASPEDGDEVPARKYVAYFSNLINSNPDTVYIFDYLPFQDADLKLWIEQAGSPNIINLKVDPNELIKRQRKKAQSDVNAQITQQQTAKANQNIDKNSIWIQKLSQLGPSSKIFQLQHSKPQILSQTHINSIIRPRVFLVQINNHLLYQNIAIKYGLGFINLNLVDLRKCAPLARKSGKRDVILCNYGKSEQRMISQDLYWIQKNIGEIRYMGIWQPQQIEVQNKYLKLERPPVPVKQKPAQGQQQKQQQVAQGDEQGKPKKIFDIYEYQWTEPVNHKNLSQWFFKLKKKIKKRTTHPKECYDNFDQIINNLNSESDTFFYEIIK